MVFYKYACKQQWLDPIHYTMIRLIFESLFGGVETRPGLLRAGPNRSLSARFQQLPPIILTYISCDVFPFAFVYT
jgi:hypothetical protein